MSFVVQQSWSRSSPLTNAPRKMETGAFAGFSSRMDRISSNVSSVLLAWKMCVKSATIVGNRKCYRRATSNCCWNKVVPGPYSDVTIEIGMNRALKSSSPNLFVNRKSYDHFTPSGTHSLFHRGRFIPKAYSNEERNSSSGLGSQEGWDPSLEIQVPEEQRPVNELSALKEDYLYNWAELSNPDFFARIGLLWAGFFLLLGAPIASATFEPFKEPIPFILAGGAGSLFPVSIIILRIYLGWSYVGNRLLSAVIPYEESGWYDGQLWVKPPEILARDRLLGSYQVKPIMSRLKQTLIGSASLLTAVTLSLVLFFPNNPDEGYVTVPRTVSTSSSPEQTVFWLKDLTNPPAEVLDDDDLAAAAALAAKGRPVYCQDRFYRALAGGQYCKSSDLKM